MFISYFIVIFGDNTLEIEILTKLPWFRAPLMRHRTAWREEGKEGTMVGLGAEIEKLRARREMLEIDSASYSTSTVAKVSTFTRPTGLYSNLLTGDFSGETG